MVGRATRASKRANTPTPSASTRSRRSPRTTVEATEEPTKRRGKRSRSPVPASTRKRKQPRDGEGEEKDNDSTAMGDDSGSETKTSTRKTRRSQRNKSGQSEDEGNDHSSVDPADEADSDDASEKEAEAESPTRKETSSEKIPDQLSLLATLATAAEQKERHQQESSKEETGANDSQQKQAGRVDAKEDGAQLLSTRNIKGPESRPEVATDIEKSKPILALQSKKDVIDPTTEGEPVSEATDGPEPNLEKNDQRETMDKEVNEESQKSKDATDAKASSSPSTQMVNERRTPNAAGSDLRVPAKSSPPSTGPIHQPSISNEAAPLLRIEANDTETDATSLDNRTAGAGVPAKTKAQPELRSGDGLFTSGHKSSIPSENGAPAAELASTSTQITASLSTGDDSPRGNAEDQTNVSLSLLEEQKVEASTTATQSMNANGAPVETSMEKNVHGESGFAPDKNNDGKGGITAPCSATTEPVISQSDHFIHKLPPQRAIDGTGLSTVTSDGKGGPVDRPGDTSSEHRKGGGSLSIDMNDGERDRIQGLADDKLPIPKSIVPGDADAHTVVGNLDAVHVSATATMELLGPAREVDALKSSTVVTASDSVESKKKVSMQPESDVQITTPQVNEHLRSTNPTDDEGAGKTTLEEKADKHAESKSINESGPLSVSTKQIQIDRTENTAMDIDSTKAVCSTTESSASADKMEIDSPAQIQKSAGASSQSSHPKEDGLEKTKGYGEPTAFSKIQNAVPDQIQPPVEGTPSSRDEDLVKFTTVLSVSSRKENDAVKTASQSIDSGNAEERRQRIEKICLAATDEDSFCTEIMENDEKHVDAMPLQITLHEYQRSGGRYEPKASPLDALKVRIFSAGKKMHNKNVVTRLFMEYWQALTLRLEGHIDGPVAEWCQHQIDAFLKGKHLRRLHNKFVLCLLKRSLKTQVPLDELPPDISVQLRKRICVTTGIRELQTKIPVAWKASTSSRSIYREAVSRKTIVVKQLQVNGAETGGPCIPGAMSIDPHVRRVTAANGMKVTENAIWLLVVAMKEYTKRILQSNVDYKISISRGEIPRMSSLRPRLLVGSEHPVNGLTPPKSLSITASDVSACLTTMSIGSCHGLGGTVSRLSFEKSLVQTQANPFPVNDIALNEIRNFVVSSLIQPEQPDQVDTNSSSTVNDDSERKSSVNSGGLGRGAKDLASLKMRASVTRQASAGQLASGGRASVASTATAEGSRPSPVQARTSVAVGRQSIPATGASVPDVRPAQGESAVTSSAAASGRASTETGQPSVPTEIGSLRSSTATTLPSASEPNAHQSLTSDPSMESEAKGRSSMAEKANPPPASSNEESSLTKDEEAAILATASAVAGSLKIPSQQNQQPRESAESSRREGMGFGTKNLAAMKARSVSGVKEENNDKNVGT